MSGWQKVERGWYIHETGAVVQVWYSENKRSPVWHAWRPQTPDADFHEFPTRREACEWALGLEKA
jgi:hypothetical protein